MFPERHVTTTSVERGTHSMAAAMRKLETEIVLDSLPRNAWVFDIGGNWATHAKRNISEGGLGMKLRKVHCCCPLLDFRDSQRKTVRWIAVNNFIENCPSINPETGQRMKEIYDDNKRISDSSLKGDVSPEAMNGRWFCQNKFEDCVFEAEEAYAMAIHSIYDIDLTDLVDTMERKKIKMLKGTFLFSIDILLGAKSGKLPSVDGFFEVEGDKLTYSFFNDSNCGYTHSLRRLSRYLKETFVQAAGGSMYYLELTEMRGDVMFFSIVDASESMKMGVSKDESRKFLPIDGRDKVIFPLFVADDFSDELVLTETILPKDFVNKCIEYVIRSKENQLNVDNITNFLASTNNSIVINGSARRSTQKVESKLIVPIATTLLVYAEMQRASQKNIISKLRTYVKEQLSFSDLLGVSWKRIFGKRSIYQKAVKSFASWLKIANGPRILEFCEMPLYFEVIDRIDLWFKYSKDMNYTLDFQLLEKKVLNYVEEKKESDKVADLLMKDKFGVTAKRKNDTIEFVEKRKVYYSQSVPEGYVNGGFLQEWIDCDHFKQEAAQSGSNKWLTNIAEVLGDFCGSTLNYTPAYDTVYELPVSETLDESRSETSEEESSEESDGTIENDSYVGTDSTVDVKSVKFDVTSPVSSDLSSDRVCLEKIHKNVFKFGSSSNMSDISLEDVEIEEHNCESKDEMALVEDHSVENFQVAIKHSSEADSNIVGRFRLPERPNFEIESRFSENAKIEFLWYLQCKMISDKSAMYDIVCDYVYDKYHLSDCLFPKDARFFDIRESKWLFNKSVPKRSYKYGVNFEISNERDSDEPLEYCNLVELQWDCSRKNETKLLTGSMRGYIMICDLTFLMNEREIYHKCWKIFNSKKMKNDLRVVLIDGVPGCGKSTWILNNANLNKEFVLSMGKEATDDLIDKFRKDKKFSPHLFEKIRTVDSFLMHGAKMNRANVFHFDEALMAHAGTVYFCAAILGARKVICQGDSVQIPFINRVESIELKYDKLKIDSIEKKRNTYRSPVDVACFLTKKNFYGNDTVKSVNRIFRSMKTVGPRDKRGMTSKYSIPKVREAQYLTFTQSEKEEMIQYLGKTQNWSVSTVHEAQGKTFDDVILVRLKETANEIYPGGRKSEPYTVVATTRHRRSLIYYTKAEDALYGDINEMMHVMEDTLCKHLIDESVK